MINCSNMAIDIYSPRENVERPVHPIRWKLPKLFKRGIFNDELRDYSPHIRLFIPLLNKVNAVNRADVDLDEHRIRVL